MQLSGKTKFTFTFNSTQGLSWPEVSLTVNDQYITRTVIDDQNKTLSAVVNLDQEGNTIILNYVNKTEQETIVEDGKIIKDQSLELAKVHIDDILVDSWFWTESYYYPRYFESYLKQFPSSPRQLKSQLIWHFPGAYIINKIPNANQFWDNYHKTRMDIIVKNLDDPTGHLIQNLTALDEEDKENINEIKRIIDV